MFFLRVLLFLCVVLNFFSPSCNASRAKKQPRKQGENAGNNGGGGPPSKAGCTPRGMTKSKRGRPRSGTVPEVETLHQEQVECTGSLFDFVSRCYWENDARDRSPQALMNMFPGCSEISDERFTRLRSSMACARPDEFGSCLDELDQHPVSEQWGECFLVDTLASGMNDHYDHLSARCRFISDESYVKVLEWLICRMDVMKVEAMLRRQPELLHLKLFDSVWTIFHQLAQHGDAQGFKFALEVGNYSYIQIKEAILLALTYKQHSVVHQFFFTEGITNDLKFELYCDLVHESTLAFEDIDLLHSYMRNRPLFTKNEEEFLTRAISELEEFATTERRVQRKKFMMTLTGIRQELRSEMHERVRLKYSILAEGIRERHEQEIDAITKVIPWSKLEDELLRMERDYNQERLALQAERLHELEQEEQFIDVLMWMHRISLRKIEQSH